MKGESGYGPNDPSLAISASYIAVPAAIRLAAPKADPGLYIPMALGSPSR